MRKLFRTIRRTLIGGALFMSLAPLVPICAFMYYTSPKDPDNDEI